MIEGPATLDGVAGIGLMEVLRSGSLKETRGHFQPVDAEGRRAVLDAFNRSAGYSVYEGPVRDLTGRVLRMRVNVLLTRASFGAEDPATLVGSGPPEPVE